MIKENKGLTEIKGNKALIFCEFSTIAFELLNNGFRKDELQRALDEAIEYTEKGEDVIREERKNREKSIISKLHKLFETKEDDDTEEKEEKNEEEDRIIKMLDDIATHLTKEILKND